MEPIFPLLHYIVQHGEEQVFKQVVSEAQRQCPKPVVAQAQPVPLPQCHPHHCTPLYGMIRTRNSTGLPAQHPSPHPTCQFISDLSQNSPWGLWRKAQRGTRPGVAVFLFYLSLQQRTHPQLLAVSLAFLTLNHFHLSSSSGFSFCPCFIYFTCSAGNALKLNICIRELKSLFIKRQ